MSKIFLAFHGKERDGKLPVFYDAFVSSLEARGHQIHCFAHDIFSPIWWNQQTQVPEEVQTIVKNFNPDLCIIFNNSFYDLSEIVSCPIVIYDADSIFYYPNVNKIINNPMRYHFFVSDDCKDILINALGVPSSQVSECVPFSLVRAENLKVENNIVFIGSKFTTQPSSSINNFLAENPMREERTQYKNLLNAFAKDPYSVFLRDVETSRGGGANIRWQLFPQIH